MITAPILAAVALGCFAIGLIAGVAAGRQSSAGRKMPADLSPLNENGPPKTDGAAIGPQSDAVAELAGGLPVPSEEMIYLVTPSFDGPQFLRSGVEHLESLCSLLRNNGVPLGSLKAALDFGCGCGRVLRHFPKLGLKDLSLYGSDYNAYLIDWCRQNLPFARFEVNNLEPPLKYPAQLFDFVYAISVFTHLTEPLQFAWLDEMARIIKPGGCLAITVHGSAFLIDLDEDQQRRFRSGQLVIKYPENVGKNSCGAYHPVQYIKEKFTYSFDILEVAEQTNLRWQDFYLLRRKA
jgi:ubiquinone/menaquinone biosynthesis C-methylase UbiE